MAAAQQAVKTARETVMIKMPAVLRFGGTIVAAIAVLTLVALPCSAQQLTNSTLSVTVNREDGSYHFGRVGGQSVLHTSVGAMVDHKWLRSGTYPSHAVSESPFAAKLGSG